MSMLTALSQHLAEMLDGLGLFASVNQTVSGKESYPAAHIWLAEDVFVQDKPNVSRRLDWSVQITTFAEDSLVSSLTMVDAVRDLFADARLPGHGHVPISVPEIKITEHSAEKGVTVYLVTVRVTVFPQLFSLT